MYLFTNNIGFTITKSWTQFFSVFNLWVIMKTTE